MNIHKIKLSKPKILFVTQTLNNQCGIGLIGDLFGKCLEKHPKFFVEVFYSNNINEVKDKIRGFNPDAILYNYHPITTYWVDDLSLRVGEFSHIPQARVMHDIDQHFVNIYKPENNHGWKFNFTSDHLLTGNKHIYPTTRMIPPPPSNTYDEPSIPTIGYQGFGFPHKGIHRIAEKVIKEFDEAIIRLHIPYAFYGDRDGAHARQRVVEVKNIVSKNPKIQVVASHEFLNTDKLIDFISQNTINCYFYDYLDGVALSSSLDYGLSARRPIAVTKSHQMRNVWNLKPSILIEENSLKDIINNGIEPLKPLYSLYSEEKFFEDYSNGIEILLNL
jgi:hypothetical protein